MDLTIPSLALAGPQCQEYLMEKVEKAVGLDSACQGSRVGEDHALRTPSESLKASTATSHTSSFFFIHFPDAPGTNQGGVFLSAVGSVPRLSES